MQIEIGTMKHQGILDEIDVLGGKNWLKTEYNSGNFVEVSPVM
jgi:hypothetical protein